MRSYLILVFLALFTPTVNCQTCSELATPCLADTDCFARYNAYTTACNSIFYDFSGGASCPPNCVARLNDLLAHPLGVNLSNCDCGNDLEACRIPSDNLKLGCFGVEPVPKCNLSTVPALSESFCTNFILNCLADAECREAYLFFWAGNPLFDVPGTAVCASPWSAGWCNPTCKQALYDFMCQWGKVPDRTEGCACKPDDEDCDAVQISLANRIEASCLASDQRTSLQFCDNTDRECREDSACGPLLTQFENSCEKLINGETTNCSSECFAAFGALNADPIGTYFRRCTCERGDNFCIRRGSYMAFYCFGDVLGVPQVCNDILSACEEDPICNQTRHKFLMACNPDLTDEELTCSDTCKRFNLELSIGAIGSRLDKCYCIASDTGCLAYQAISNNCADSPTEVPTSPPTDFEKAFARWEASYEDWLVKYEQWVNDQCPDAGSGNAGSGDA